MIVLVQYYTTVLSLWHYCTFNVSLFIPLPHFIRGRFVNFSTHRNKSLHKATFLSLVKTACSTATSFQVFLYQYVYKLVWSVIDVLAQSSISRSHCGRLSPSCNLGHHSILLILFIFSVFSRHGNCRLATIFSLGCCAVLHFSLPFVFIAVPFSSLPSILSLISQTAIITAFHSTLDLSFVGLLFLLCKEH